MGALYVEVFFDQWIHHDVDAIRTQLLTLTWRLDGGARHALATDAVDLGQKVCWWAEWRRV